MPRPAIASTNGTGGHGGWCSPTRTTPAAAFPDEAAFQDVYRTVTDTPHTALVVFLNQGDSAGVAVYRPTPQADETSSEAAGR